MKIIKVTIAGAMGRMGKALIQRLSKKKKLKLFSLTDIKSGKTINGIQTQKNNLEAFKKTDVINDFSRPKASLEILNYAKKLKKKVVIGTTGFTKQQNNLIKNYSKKIPNDYHIGINDDHHKKKIDYPSGTALMLANAVSRGKNKNLEVMKGKFFFNKKLFKENCYF